MTKSTYHDLTAADSARIKCGANMGACPNQAVMCERDGSFWYFCAEHDTRRGRFEHGVYIPNAVKITEQFNVGHANYVVNFCTGKKHPDGSDFYDIRIFSNKRLKDRFIRELQRVRLYECGICSCLHRVGFNGDCREDAHRFASPDDYAERFNVSEFDIDVVSMEESEAQ